MKICRKQCFLYSARKVKMWRILITIQFKKKTMIRFYLCVFYLLSLVVFYFFFQQYILQNVKNLVLKFKLLISIQILFITPVDRDLEEKYRWTFSRNKMKNWRCSDINLSKARFSKKLSTEFKSSKLVQEKKKCERKP